LFSKTEPQQRSVDLGIHDDGPRQRENSCLALNNNASQSEV
jgi:hypothetical protein